MKTHTVFACESQPIAVEGLQRVLESCSDLQWLGHAPTTAEALSKARECHPDIVVVDQAPGLKHVIAFVSTLQAELPAASCVLWVNEMTHLEAFRLLQAGARGLIRRDAPVSDLLACFRAVASGKVWIGDPQTREVTTRNAARSGVRLTPRERDIIGLVSQGLKNREIADRLSITPGTVKVHLMHIFEKTGAEDRFSLALNARWLLGDRQEAEVEAAARQLAHAGDGIEVRG